jgi:glycosyltransferase involved in cell wall biosynthesis
MALLEAMSMGVPNVASRIDSVAEVIEDGVSGLLFQPGNDREIAHQIARLLKDPLTAKKMGSAGRHRVEACYASAAMATRYEDLFCSLLKGSRGRNRLQKALSAILKRAHSHQTHAL